MKRWYIKKIALERIKILLKRAEEDEKRSKRYVELARRISEKCRVRIPKHLRIRICKKCNSFLIPGRNCRVRINKHRIIITCLNCGNIKRYPLIEEIKIHREFSRKLIELKNFNVSVKKISRGFFEIEYNGLKCIYKINFKKNKPIVMMKVSNYNDLEKASELLSILKKIHEDMTILLFVEKDLSENIFEEKFKGYDFKIVKN